LPWQRKKQVNKLEQTIKTMGEQYSHLEQENSNLKTDLHNEQINFQEYIERSGNKVLKVCLAAFIAGIGLTSIYQHMNSTTPYSAPIEITQIEQTDKTKPNFQWSINQKVIFNDKNVTEMKAFYQKGTNIILLKGRQNSLTEKWFSIPKDYLQEEGSFQVFAIDKHGNESEKTILYSIDGYISETK
jgi:hypothetical protein